tara:strand:- start:156 stop:821 length:666 start_codon:yes stop_codon:yes gene_type:complete
MIKLKNIMNENYWTGRKFGEALPTLRLEQDEPEHFGGGENIKILDYQTEHFDICQSAVILYKRLVKDVDNTDAQDLIISSAKQLDHLFEMEKQVVRGEELDHDPIDMGVEIINIVSYQLGRIGGMINDDFERDTSFLKLHIMEIINRKDSIKIADKQEEEPVDENLKPHEKKISKAFKTTDKTEIKGIDRLIDMSQIGDVLKMQKKNPKDFKKMINRIGKM